MIVLPPLYDLPEIQPANDRLWQEVAAGLAAAGLSGLPERPARGLDPGQALADPGLLLAQVSPLALFGPLAARLRLVATPRYRAPGLSGSRYRAFIVVRADNPAHRLIDLRGARCALNDRASNSGMNLLRAAVAPLSRDGRFFGAVIETGSHAASLEALAGGRADVAAIDCVTHALLGQHRPGLVAGTRVLAVTAATPAPPLVTAAAVDEPVLDLLRQALRAAAAAPDLAPARAALLIDGFEPLPERAYRIVRTLGAQAAERGYPELA